MCTGNSISLIYKNISVRLKQYQCKRKQRIKRIIIIIIIIIIIVTTKGCHTESDFLMADFFISSRSRRMEGFIGLISMEVPSKYSEQITAPTTASALT